MADHITTLVEVYNRWLDNNDIKDRGSASEILFGYEPLTDYQKEWLSDRDWETCAQIVTGKRL